MTLALPDLMAYSITTKSPDVIEDAVGWMANQKELAPDGKVGIVGISFAGGLSTSAAGRPSIKRQGGVRAVVRRPRRHAAGDEVSGDRRGAAGAGRGHAPAARLRRRGHPLSARRVRRRAARPGARRCATACAPSCSRRSSRSSTWTRPTRRSQKARDMADDAARAVAHLHELRERPRRERSSVRCWCRSCSSSGPTTRACHRSARRRRRRRCSCCTATRTR